MSERRKAAMGAPQNPAKRFFEWSSAEKCFKYYDKEKQENVMVKLPFKFLYLDQMITVKGWSESHQSGIWSNEVPTTSKDILMVKTKKGEIAKGTYKDIKEKVVAAGARYVQSVYIFMPDGEIANLQLKGSALAAWSEFTQKSRRRLPDEWVTIKTVEDKKKGATKYSQPVFQFDGSITQLDAERADTCFDILKDHFKEYLGAPPADPAQADHDEVEVDDPAW
ncbi:MAG TPA: hypothetical protein VFV37_10970 [Luteibaculaceae bacterium]|nr:hypothetical protein [Luteibaculaceae bacterium]